MKNPEKMSERELRREVMFLRECLNLLKDGAAKSGEDVTFAAVMKIQSEMALGERDE